MGCRQIFVKGTHKTPQKYILWEANSRCGSYFAYLPETREKTVNYRNQQAIKQCRTSQTAKVRINVCCVFFSVSNSSLNCCANIKVIPGEQTNKLLGMFAKLQKVAASFDFCPFTWNNLAPTGWIFMQSEAEHFSNMSSRKLKSDLKSDNNNGYFT
jgi:hypothetical protein